jgi:hypothetical protein
MNDIMMIIVLIGRFMIMMLVVFVIGRAMVVTVYFFIDGISNNLNGIIYSRLRKCGK